MPFFHLGLIGYPLEHSLSPRLQTAALQAAGLAGEYRLYPVPLLPGGLLELQALLDRLRQRELQGLNVTIPHKSAILPYLDELVPIARAAGAVNTLYMHNDRLTGDNTDVGGFLTDLGRFFTSIGRDLPFHGASPQIALVLGAGGSAQAVVYTLAQAGFQVWVAARRIEQAQSLGSASVRILALTPAGLGQLPDEVSLIVNTTPLGMAPNIHASAWPVEVPFPPNACVYDLVYNPPETALICLARNAGLPARSGLGMLVEQAALAFERWTGQSPSRLEMQAALPE